MSNIKDDLLLALWQDPNYEVHQVSCQEITIEAIDHELYSRLLAEATAAGAHFDGVKASINGLEFDWNYDAECQVLQVTCTRKPFYATCSDVESKIREMVAKSKGAI